MMLPFRILDECRKKSEANIYHAYAIYDSFSTGSYIYLLDIFL